MKNLKLIGMALVAILMCVNFSSCNSSRNEYGMPTNIAKNTIIYKTLDNTLLCLKYEDVFGGAKIVSNTYSTTDGYGTIEFSSKVTSIDSQAFSGESTLIAIVLPPSITRIGRNAFHDCSSLTAVTIPNSVTSIEDYAFCYCSNLTEVTFPNSVTSIGDYAFHDCSSLTAVTFPNSVTSIGDRAFSACSSLTQIICESATPPTASYRTFAGVKLSIPLSVPKGSKDVYANADCWYTFSNIVEM